MNPFGGAPVFAQPAAPAPAFGAAPAPAAGLGPVGVSFQCEMKNGAGEAINFFLHFGPEAATSVDAIGALAGQLMQANVPLKLWRPSQKNNGFNRGGGGFR